MPWKDISIFQCDFNVNNLLNGFDAGEGKQELNAFSLTWKVRTREVPGKLEEGSVVK